ncbi:MAG: hypothetical protein CMK32_07205 [Porticoccaceae bacterium]|nr:hypothetical protein [Porticoccaceae bacterium]
MPSKTTLIVLFAMALATGCSYFQFPGIHKVEVQQGNIITQDMIDQLRPGMTKSQVSYIMGTPMIADTFHQDRWDYYYSVKKEQDDHRKEHVIIFFENGKLSSIRGDYAPSGARADTTTEKAGTDG